MENPPQKKKDKVLFPLIAVWAAPITKLCLDFLAAEINRYFRRKEGYIISLIIDFVGSLVASTFVTLSFEKTKYCFYKTGLIIILVMAIPMTVILSSVIDHPIIIALIAVEWSQAIVLIIYNNRVKKRFSESELKNNLNNNSPQAIQSLV